MTRLIVSIVLLILALSVAQVGIAVAVGRAQPNGHIGFVELEIIAGRAHTALIDARAGKRFVPAFAAAWKNDAFWSPDGTRLGFNASVFGSEQAEYFAVPFYGGPARQLSITRAGRDTFATWSPDGRYLASAAPDGLRIINVSTGEDRRLTPGRSTIGWPAWSPDSTQIVFTAGQYGSFNLLVADLNTGGIRLLTDDFMSSEIAPVWSPDGQHIAYIAGSDNDFDIYIVDINGQTPRLLVRTQRVHEHRLAWLHKGTHLRTQGLDYIRSQNCTYDIDIATAAVQLVDCSGEWINWQP